jgi:predicted acyl esterase
VPARPAVRVFVTGENRWLESDRWPATEGNSYRLYLSGNTNRILTESNPVGMGTLTADPFTPIPAKGGKLCCHQAYPGGAWNQALIEERRDDVAPDGIAVNVADGGFRLRYRNSMAFPEFMQPCQPAVLSKSISPCSSRRSTNRRARGNRIPQVDGPRHDCETKDEAVGTRGRPRGCCIERTSAGLLLASGWLCLDAHLRPLQAACGRRCQRADSG